MAKSIAFDRAVEYYDQTRGYPAGIEAQAVAVVANALGLAAGQPVLEVGIGTGRMAVPLMRTQGYSYYGMDLSMPMMLKLREKQQPGENIPLLQGDATMLPYKSGSFAGVVVVHVFHLVSDRAAMIAEIKRVLQPGASLVAVGDSVPQGDNIQSELARKFDDFLREGGGEPRRQPDGPSEWDATLADLQAASPNVEDYTAFEWPQSRTPATLLDGFRRRIWSGQWDIADDTYQPALDKFSAWLQTEYGDRMNEPITNQRKFRVTKATF